MQGRLCSHEFDRQRFAGPWPFTVAQVWLPGPKDTPTDERLSVISCTSAVLWLASIILSDEAARRDNRLLDRHALVAALVDRDVGVEVGQCRS